MISWPPMQHGRPELVCQDLLDMQDPNGVYLVKEPIAAAGDKGRGRVSYGWGDLETGKHLEDSAGQLSRSEISTVSSLRSPLPWARASPPAR